MPIKDPIKRKEYKQKYDALRPKEKRRKRDMEHKKSYDQEFVRSPEATLKKLDQSNARRYRDKLSVFRHYSQGEPRCKCCGMTGLEFLALDHLNGHGNEHRKTVPNHKMYRWAINNNFPSMFQILCHSCNTAKGANGKCPHQNYQWQWPYNPDEPLIIDFSYMG